MEGEGHLPPPLLHREAGGVNIHAKTWSGIEPEKLPIDQLGVASRMTVSFRLSTVYEQLNLRLFNTTRIVVILTKMRLVPV